MMNRELLRHELAKLEISDDADILTDVLEFYFSVARKSIDSQQPVDRALELIVEKILELAESDDEK